MDEPAFPSHGTMGEVNFQGMSLRDYLAAKAMQAFVNRNGYFPKLSESSYNIADTMLAERSRK